MNAIGCSVLLVLFILYNLCDCSQPQDVYPYSCDCSKLYQPVCGSDGETYFNECYLSCRMNLDRPALYHYHNGRCEEDWTKINGVNDLMAPAPCLCPAFVNLVCGSDGKTYVNECYLSCMRDNVDPCVRKAYNGVCDKPRKAADFPRLHIDCPDIYFPVCGTDGKTYTNNCYLTWEKKRNKPSLEIDYEGPCKDPLIDEFPENILKKGFNPKCPKFYSPVCGSDGKVYWNDCYLDFEKRMYNPQIWKVYEGLCQNDWIRS